MSLQRQAVALFVQRGLTKRCHEWDNEDGRQDPVPILAKLKKGCQFICSGHLSRHADSENFITP